MLSAVDFFDAICKCDFKAYRDAYCCILSALLAGRAGYITVEIPSKVRNSLLESQRESRPQHKVFKH